MSLLDDIEAETTGTGPRCTVALLLRGLTDDDRADLETALANPAIPASAIHRALHKRGHSIGDTTLQRHRRGTCRCPR